MSQSAVSQQVKTLEEELKTALFVRGGSSLTLTDSGKEFLPIAKNILTSVEDAAEHFTRVNSLLEGQLNIGIGSFVEPYIRKATAMMIENYPNVRLKLIYAQTHILNRLLYSHEIDMAFTMNTAYADENIESHPAIPFHLSAIMRRNHPLADKERLTFDDLCHQRIIMPDGGDRVMQTIRTYADVPFERIKASVIINDPDACRNLVQETNMITVLPCMYVSHYPNLLAKPIVGLEMLFNSNVHWLQDTHHKESAKAFLQIVKDYSVPYCVNMT